MAKRQPIPFFFASQVMVVVHGFSCSKMWNFLRLGINPISSALAGRFLTTGPPGKTCLHVCKPRVSECRHAKSFQSCLTLYNPMECSPPGSCVHGDSPWKNTGVSSHDLLQGIFLTQGSNLCLLCLLHCRWIIHHWAMREAPLLANCFLNFEILITISRDCFLLLQ